MENAIAEENSEVKEGQSLSREQAARIAHMRDEWTLAYDRYTEWFEQALDHVAAYEPGKLILLIAPTHVGKTALMQHCDRALIEMARRDGLPVGGSAYVRIPSPHRGNLDVGELIDRLLEALGQPSELLAHIAEYGDIREGALKPSQMPRVGRTPTHRARMRALIDRINRGYFSAAFLDEAGEIPLLLKSGKVLEAAMSIKEIADLSRKPTFLAGGPEIAPLLWQSAQLTARIQPIWMCPLDPSKKNDVLQFAGVLATLAKELGPDYIRTDVFNKSRCTYLARQLWGTVGLGTKVVFRATAASLRGDGKPLEWPLLKGWTDYMHQHLSVQMVIEHAMFAAAMDPDNRADYWASASHMAITPQNFHKRGAKTIEVPEDLASLAKAATNSKNRKKGLTPRNIAERPLLRNLPGEPGADLPPESKTAR
ncbi:MULTISPECIES: TniB family NTP-binding protein [unclassified Caballeronia]|uniref:TniB family NTP-binding protein n=1 Tax=unclassified Caballeronia TaxID=2646786 RepID=UPI002027F97E|nr:MULTISPECIES: TniB family NTP-binding protein [unclassified Caballeronia]MDR5768093.1 TniB family NTP-binding protein [Caballeronia sp. LZ028]